MVLLRQGFECMTSWLVNVRRVVHVFVKRIIGVTDVRINARFSVCSCDGACLWVGHVVGFAVGRRLETVDVFVNVALVAEDAQLW